MINVLTHCIAVFETDIFDLNDIWGLGLQVLLRVRTLAHLDLILSIQVHSLLQVQPALQYISDGAHWSPHFVANDSRRVESLLLLSFRLQA